MIFVFGSNLSGRHGKGAALTARLQHGAQYGKAEGPTGNSYALPTCGHRFEPLSLDEIYEHVQRFINYAKQDWQTEFQITRIGCGLGRHKDEHIAPMFWASSRNCFFDKKWEDVLIPRQGGYRYWGTF